MTPLDPFSAAPAPLRSFVIGRAIFVVGAISMLVLSLLLFVSGLLGGGQFGPSDTIKWDPLVPWPMVAIPGWLVIPLCWLGPIGAAVLIPGARWPQAIEFPWLLAVTVLMFSMMPFGFAKLYPDAAGPLLETVERNTGINWAWVAAAPQLLALVGLGVRLAMLAPGYNAARRESLSNLR